MLVNMNVSEFLQEVGSSSPAPGGGSCSALASSIGSALSLMVCNLTFGKKSFDALDTDAKESFEKAYNKLLLTTKNLEELIDLDTLAFNQIMAAFKLPKESDEDKVIRSNKIQEATLKAIEVPLNIMEESLNALASMTDLIDNCNQNAISDIGVGALLLSAGVKGGGLNVKINLSSLKDQIKKAEIEEKLNKILNSTDIITEELLSKVESAIQ